MVPFNALGTLVRALAFGTVCIFAFFAGGWVIIPLTTGITNSIISAASEAICVRASSTHIVFQFKARLAFRADALRGTGLTVYVRTLGTLILGQKVSLDAGRTLGVRRAFFTVRVTAGVTFLVLQKKTTLAGRTLVFCRTSQTVSDITRKTNVVEQIKSWSTLGTLGYFAFLTVFRTVHASVAVNCFVGTVLS